MNLYPKTKVPLGFSLAGTVARTPELGVEDERSTVSAAFQIAYTGRDDFMIGLESSWQSLPLEDLDQTLDLLGTSFALRYFF